MTRDLFVRYPRVLRPGSVRLHLAYGPGWFRLVDEFFAGVNERLPDDLASRFCIDQIKEKFGRMRIYYSFSMSSACEELVADASLDRLCSEIDDLKLKAQGASGTTCFFCGAPGAMRETPWVRVSCDDCERKLEAMP